MQRSADNADSFPAMELGMTDHIQKYYSPNDLYGQIIAGLVQLGIPLDKVTIDNLQAVDEFHIRGDAATQELIQLAGFTPDMHILDVGCGIGGSTRRLAHSTGCRVTGIDLSDSYIDTAERLTELLHMQERVQFKACSALALPYPDNHFDGVWSLHMNMNVEDKLGWLKEIHRVLKPGAKAVLYEVCGGETENSQYFPVPYFPVPWAQDASMSFLVPPSEFRSLIEQAGLAVSYWVDKTPQAMQTFAKAKLPEGEPKLPVLGVYLLVGRDIQTKAYKLKRNLEEGRVTLVEVVGVKG